MTANWRPGTQGPNRLFQKDGRLLRERAWDLYHNNPFANSAVRAYVANVIECGINPEWDDEERENAWERWGGLTAHATRECDITRDSTINELQQIWLTELLVGGGCLVHYVTMPRKSQRIPLALEMFGEERFADHVQMSGTNPKTANPVLNGVEIDASTGRTVAYHVFATQPNDLSFDPTRTIRLAADQCEYAFFKERTGAKRGTTVFKPAVIWLWGLGYYADNEIKASDLKSSWGVMINTDSAEADPLLSGQRCLTDLNGNPIDHHEAGMIWRGAPGDEIKGIGPNVPGADSLPWITMIERAVAVGVGLSYEEVFRDYSQGSFSSVRMARGADKKRFKPIQNFCIVHLGNPTVNRFEQAAVGALVPGFPSPTEYLNSRDEMLHETDWQTPGWDSPNPKDDAAANHQKLQDGTISRGEICAAEGRSWKRTRKRLVREQRDIEDDGLILGGATVFDPAAPGDQVPQDAQPQDKGRSTR